MPRKPEMTTVFIWSRFKIVLIQSGSHNDTRSDLPGRKSPAVGAGPQKVGGFTLEDAVPHLGLALSQLVFFGEAGVRNSRFFDQRATAGSPLRARHNDNQRLQSYDGP